MKLLKFVNIVLIVLAVLLLSFDLLLVLPEYYACKNAPAGEEGKTIWGDTLDCFGESAEFSWTFFVLISGVAAALILTAAVLARVRRKYSKLR